MQTGERIRTLREEAGFSQNRLAEMVGISQTHLRRVELGQAGISVDHLEMICDALKITLKEFFDVDGTEAQEEIAVAAAKLTPKRKELLISFLKSL